MWLVEIFLPVIEAFDGLDLSLERFALDPVLFPDRGLLVDRVKTPGNARKYYREH